MMKVNLEHTDDFLEIQIEGRVDATSVADFEALTLEEVSNEVKAVLINFDQVEYISSAGLRSILKIAKICQEKKTAMCCFKMQPPVFEVFKISGFSSIINIFESKEAAIATIK